MKSKTTTKILGKQIKDIITGISGTCVAWTMWHNGCVRLQIQPYGQNADGKPKEAIVIDEHDVEILPEPKKERAKTRTGGPTTMKPGIRTGRV